MNLFELLENTKWRSRLTPKIERIRVFSLKLMRININHRIEYLALCPMHDDPQMIIRRKLLAVKWL